MVVAQLVEQSLPTQEIRSSNPDISKILSTNCAIRYRKDKNKEKEAWNGTNVKNAIKGKKFSKDFQEPPIPFENRAGSKKLQTVCFIFFPLRPTISSGSAPTTILQINIFVLNGQKGFPTFLRSKNIRGIRTKEKQEKMKANV